MCGLVWILHRFDLGVDHCQLASLDVLLDSGVPVPYLLGMRDGTPLFEVEAAPILSAWL